MHSVKLNYAELAIYSIYFICALSFEYYLWGVYNTNHDLQMIMIGSCITACFGATYAEIYLYYKLFTTNNYNPAVCGIACVFLLANVAIERISNKLTGDINYKVGEYLHSLTAAKEVDKGK
jgi:hypothetical protein